MKKIWILTAIALIGATNCSHPYEEGMTGAFPYFELAGSKTITFDAATNLKGEIELNSNMAITTRVDYPNSATSGTGWIEAKPSSDSKTGTVKIALTLTENKRREARKAVIAILADGKSTGEAITVNQNGFVIQSGSSNVYNGNLTLATQDEVNNCIYTDVIGKLIIGKENENSDIQSLNALNCINSVRDGLIVMNCDRLSELGEIHDINVPYVEFRGNVSTALIGSYDGKTNRLVINSMTSPILACSFLSGFDGIVEFEINNTSVISLDGIRILKAIQSLTLKNNGINQLSNDVLALTTLKNLDLTDNPLLNVNMLAEMNWLQTLVLTGTTLSTPQVKYLEDMMPKTGITKLNLNGGNAKLTVGTPNTQVYSASFKANLSNMNSFVEAGYCLGTDQTLKPYSEWTRLENIIGMGVYDFTVNALTSGQTYYLRLYAVDGNGSYYVSEAVSFKTVVVEYFNFTANPILPDFENASTGTTFSQMYCFVVKTEQDNAWYESLTLDMTDSGGAYSTLIHEGLSPMSFFMSTSEINDFTIGAADLSDNTKALWEVKAANPAGADEDIVTATFRHNFVKDIREDISFTRPVAKINLSVDFNGSIGRLDDIRKINVSLDNFNEEFVFGDDGHSEYKYSAPYTYSFETSTTGVNWTGIVNVTNGRFVMPHIENGSHNATVTVTFEDGSVMTKTAVLDDTALVTANMVCDMTVKVTMNRATGSFTIDDVVFVDDTIEF